MDFLIINHVIMRCAFCTWLGGGLTTNCTCNFAFILFYFIFCTLDVSLTSTSCEFVMKSALYALYKCQDPIVALHKLQLDDVSQLIPPGCITSLFEDLVHMCSGQEMRWLFSQVLYCIEKE